MQVKTRQVDHSLFFEVGGARYVAWPTKEVKANMHVDVASYLC